MPLHIHLLFFVASLVQLVINLRIITVLSHVEGDWATLLLDHSQVLYVLVSVEEKLPCVELDQDARHRPDITLLVPLLVFKDHLWGPVLARVDDEGMSLVRVGGPTKVNQLDLC